MAGGGTGTQAFASSLTDLMTSLAVIFVLLLVVFLKQSHDQSRKAKEQVQKQLSSFMTEKNLAVRQDAEDPLKLVVMMDESKLRFPVSSATLSTDGALFVGNFFKTFGHEICQPALREKIDSVVIEGHTDTSGERTPEGVRNNISLSQRRSFSVLEHALKSVQDDPGTYECLLKLASANGRGSRSPINVGGVYNPDLSRRVEVKIRVRSAEQQFRQIAENALSPSTSATAAAAPAVTPPAGIPPAPTLQTPGNK